MSNAYIMTMRRPQEALGLAAPIGKRIGEIGRTAWMALLVCFTIFGVGLYIYQVNSSASKGYTVRDLQGHVERLKETVADLETQSVQLEAMHSLEARVAPLGYVAVDHVGFLDAAKGTYALAR